MTPRFLSKFTTKTRFSIDCEPSFCMPNEDKCYFAKLQTDDGEKLFRGCTTENLPKTACQCLPDGGFVCTSGNGGQYSIDET